MIPIEHYRLVPLAEATSPKKPGPMWSYQDYWWRVDEHDNLFVYVGAKGRHNSPQCNPNREIVERHGDMPVPTITVQVPWVWLQFKISEYTS